MMEHSSEVQVARDSALATPNVAGHTEFAPSVEGLLSCLQSTYGLSPVHP